MPQAIRQKRVKRDAIARQVANVKRYATHVLIIGKDGELEYYVNEDGLLKVLAVIGAHRNRDYDVDEAVLLEIGMNRTRPYRVLQFPQRLRQPGMSRRIQPRHDGFNLTREQYAVVAPAIFAILVEQATNQVTARKTGWMPYTIRGLGHRSAGDKLSKIILTKKGKLFGIDLQYDKLPSVRYTISQTDQFLLRDIYWAEIFGNLTVQANLRVFGDSILPKLKVALKKARRSPRDWSTSPYFRAAYEVFDMFRTKPYLQRILLRDHIKAQNYFYDVIAQKLGWVDDSPIEEELLALAAVDDPESRLEGIQIKIWRKFGGLLSFDIYPPPPKSNEAGAGIPAKSF